ncbi:LacI family DNA-binding transcriptional regulator [Virgibacillus sp. NKC19-3]|uniref:LacI family DNA-binding transcriptional regulator n=1 Tax=Virgibacillus saliphilus TaxID=2831674 RepID=UPI001C9A830A|nr:LacI family DNA-binding transcriptional regulator [Virgibacillus sp. NKC19-3]MBY7142818.1 LacI family DNA-binding transcriptional regulator [Virgibacillus sp. NKC19-3]
MVNIQQVAKEAGVSVATVSRVLHEPNVVTVKTKLKVEEAIQKLNYNPSMLGRNLRKSESRLLLILIPDISNPFYFDIIKGIESVFIRNHYNILLCETNSNPERENIYFDLIRAKMADGIISMDPAVNMEALMDLAENYPVIQCSEYTDEGDIPYVTIDNEAASHRAVKHLIKIGNEKVALINSNKKYLYTRQRKKGYQRALEEQGISVRSEYIYHTDDLGFDYGQQTMKRILKLTDPPTAIFTVSDLLAIGALKEIHAQGLHVPDDIAVIGFDKIDFSNMTNPALTTIAQPMYKMGTIAADMLIQKIKGEHVESIILDHELVIREST